MDELFGNGAIDTYPYLGHMLGVPLEGAALDRVRLLDPPALQAQYLAALRRLLLALAARRPLALILEDIHWADPASTDLLIKLLPLASEAPVLIALIARPDRDAPGWKLVMAARESMGAGLTELTLSPLSDTDTQAMITNLLQIETLPDPVRRLVRDKAEGNPLFIEEVIRMLIEHGAIRREGETWVTEAGIDALEIPDTLQGLLLARIDRLPEEDKHTLRVAAVIGRQFSVKVLEQVLDGQDGP
jgi:predicted ATPase